MELTLTEAAAIEKLEAAHYLGIRPGLERTEALLDVLGNPHRRLRGVLVAGTNGKGSVCATLDTILRASGLRAALLVKPHLQSWRERICIDGEPISSEEFAELVFEAVDAAGQMDQTWGAATQFDLLTAAGILAASHHQVDALVCEVGMGGRLDSTNVLDLGTVVITNVAKDHIAYLGDTLVEIAKEKAGVIKPNTSVITSATGEALDVVRDRAQGNELWVMGEQVKVDGATRGLDGIELTISDEHGTLHVKSPLIGEHQISNTALAVMAAQTLRAGFPAITDAAIIQGCATVRWPGRLQWIPGEPSFLLDGAHNPAAMDALVSEVPDLIDGRPLTVVMGVMRDKEFEPMLSSLRRITNEPIFTAAPLERAMPPDELAQHWGGGIAEPNHVTALNKARDLTTADGVVLVCGSLALVGATLNWLDLAYG